MNWKLPILGVAVIIIAWVGYIAYAVITANPTVHASWGYVDEKTTEIWIKAGLNRPLLVPVKVENLSLSFMGIPVAKVARFDYGATKRDVKLGIAIDNLRLVDSLFRYLDNGQSGELSVQVSGKILGILPVNRRIQETVNEDILSGLSIQTKSRDFANGLLKSPPVVETILDWEGERDGKGILTAHVRLYNPNTVPIPLTRLSFYVYANGIKIASGSTEKSIIIPPNGYKTVDAKVYIEKDGLPQVWAAHVKNGEVSRVKVDISMRITLPNGEYSVPLPAYETTVKTNIMDELNSMLESLLSG